MRRRAAYALTLVVVCAGLAYAPTAQAACLATPDCLEASFPADYAWPTLAPGPAGNQSGEQVVTVSSNQSWGIRIASDLADGRMKEWTGSAYVTSGAKKLTNAMEWTLARIGTLGQPVSYSPFSSTAAKVVSAQPSTCLVTCATAEVAVTYRQKISFADRPAGANDYRIGVTYEAAQGF